MRISAAFGNFVVNARYCTFLVALSSQFPLTRIRLSSTTTLAVKFVLFNRGSNLLSVFALIRQLDGPNSSELSKLRYGVGRKTMPSKIRFLWTILFYYWCCKLSFQPIDLSSQCIIGRYSTASFDI